MGMAVSADIEIPVAAQRLYEQVRGGGTGAMMRLQRALEKERLLATHDDGKASKTISLAQLQSAVREAKLRLCKDDIAAIFFHLSSDGAVTGVRPDRVLKLCQPHQQQSNLF